MSDTPDAQDLTRKGKTVYYDVATAPDEEYSFGTGRELAERLGYPPADLNRVPPEAVVLRENPQYEFPTGQVRTASTRYGMKAHTRARAIP